MSGTNRLRESTQEIRRFIMEDLEAQPASIAKRVSARFHISGTSANRHLKRLADEGILIGSGRTRARSYKLAVLADGSRTIDLEAAPEEHIVWEEFGFTKTHVPVELARYEGENLISRSQARRLLARFERFKEVFLDFKGVVSIGQAFADEIFRVYFFEHPEVKIVYAQANPDVDAMIRRALAGRAEIPPGTMGDRG